MTNHLRTGRRGLLAAAALLAPAQPAAAALRDFHLQVCRP